MIYVAIDGDHIGARLEQYLLENRETELAEFSNYLSSLVESIADSLNREGYSIIYCGGDSVLAKSRDDNLAPIYDAAQESEVTFSAGVGASCRDAYVALKYAKKSGRNRFVEYHGKAFSVLTEDLSKEDSDVRR